MVVYLHEVLDRRLRADGPLIERDVYEATVAGAVLRLRPKLMTIAATVLGLLPILLSTRSRRRRHEADRRTSLWEE